MLKSHEESEIIDTSSQSNSPDAFQLSPEETKNIANSAHGVNLDSEINDDNNEPLVAQNVLLASDRKFLSESNVLFRIFAALIITGALAVAVVFIWSFWAKITGGNSDPIPVTEQPSNSDSEKKVNPVNKYKTQLALINQKGDLQPKPEPAPASEPEPEPEPEPAPEPEPEPAPEPEPEPAPAPAPKETLEIIDPLEEWAKLSELGATTGDSLAAQSNLQEQKELAESRSNNNDVTPITNREILNPEFKQDEIATNSNNLTTDNLDKKNNQKEVAKIASVSIGKDIISSNDENAQNQATRNHENLSPQAKSILSSVQNDNVYLLTKRKEFERQDSNINHYLNNLSKVGTSSSLSTPIFQQDNPKHEKNLSTEQKQFQPQNYSSLSDISSKEDISEQTNTDKVLASDFVTSNDKNVPLGTVAKGEMATPITWSEGINPEQTRATINLSEPILAEDGSIALKANSSIIVEVESIGDNGLTILKAIAVSYEDSQGRLKQQPLPQGTLLIRGHENQPLIAESTTDSGGTILGQDVLIGLMGAGARGFEVLNEPDEETTISNNDFFRSSTSNNDSSLINGAAEGVFSTTKERLEERSDQIIDEELNRTKIYQVEAGTPVSIYINSFLEIRI